MLGQPDDLLVTLLGLALMNRMIPYELLEICRQQARDVSGVGSVHKTAIAALFVASWALSLVIGLVLLRQWWPLHVL